MTGWMTIGRPGYFGKRRDEKVAAFNKQYGEGNWRLIWSAHQSRDEHDFLTACFYYYERSYIEYFRDKPELLDEICSYEECYDNSMTNIASGLSYRIQEATSTHIQDIAMRNVLMTFGRKFEGKGTFLEIRSSSSNGFKFGPGNVPFYDPSLIPLPSLCPSWASAGSVEDFWQSAKYLQVKQF